MHSYSYSRTFTLLLQALALTTFVIVVKGQFPRSKIEFLPASNNVPGQGIRYTTSQPFVPAYIQVSKKLCIQGGWALYNKPSYGEYNMDDKDLNVTSLRSTISPTDCIDGPTVEKALKTTFSIRALARTSEFEIYRYKNFLSASDSNILRGPDPVTSEQLANLAYESFVIAFPTAIVNNYIICGQEGNCICVNAGNNPLMVSDVTKFPKSKPLMRLSRFEMVAAADPVCATYPNPTS